MEGSGNGRTDVSRSDGRLDGDDLQETNGSESNEQPHQQQHLFQGQGSWYPPSAYLHPPSEAAGSSSTYPTAPSHTLPVPYPAPLHQTHMVQYVPVYYPGPCIAVNAQVPGAVHSDRPAQLGALPPYSYTVPVMIPIVATCGGYPHYVAWGGAHYMHAQPQPYASSHHQHGGYYICGNEHSHAPPGVSATHWQQQQQQLWQQEGAFAAQGTYSDTGGCSSPMARKYLDSTSTSTSSSSNSVAMSSRIISDPSGGKGHAEGWGGLTESILSTLMSKLTDSDAKSVRLVCSHWRAAFDGNLEQLTPSAMMSRTIVKRFPNLRVLHLTNCVNVRNRDLMILASSGLRLHTLTLGDDVNKPWVTNSGLECVSQLTSLTSLNLQDCNSVTNNGLLALNKLMCLQALSLKGCRKLTNGGLEALQHNTALTSLNLFGCLRIADQGLLSLSRLNLVTLTLGGTRVRDEGLSYLARMTSLQELHFEQEKMTDAGINTLSSLTNLQSLALRDCSDVSGDSLCSLIPQLPKLQALDLYKNFSIDDSQLERCLEFLGSVTCLDLRGTYVTEDGLQQLTRLSSLQKLCLAPQPQQQHGGGVGGNGGGGGELGGGHYMCVISTLTQLTSLTVNNCQLVSLPHAGSLRRLKQLRELDLSDEEQREIAAKPPVNHAAVDVMATLTSLTSLDLSRRPVHDHHLSVLAERLPRLHTLIIIGCPVQHCEVQALQRRFPELVIQRKPLLLDLSCSSSDHGSTEAA